VANFLIRVVPDFGSSSGKSRILPFLGNPENSSSGNFLVRFAGRCQFSYITCSQLRIKLQLYRISAPAPANPNSGHFSEIWPSVTPANLLARFAGFADACVAIVGSVNYRSN